LENSWCESITLATGNDGREATDEALEEWIAAVPIEAPDGRIHLRRLPPP